MLKKYIPFLLAFFPLYSTSPDSGGLENTVIGKLVKNKNKRTSNPTPTEISRNLPISFCNPCIQILKNQLKISKKIVQIFLGLNVNHSIQT